MFEVRSATTGMAVCVLRTPPCNTCSRRRWREAGWPSVAPDSLAPNSHCCRPLHSLYYVFLLLDISQWPSVLLPVLAVGSQGLHEHSRAAQRGRRT